MGEHDDDDNDEHDDDDDYDEQDDDDDYDGGGDDDKEARFYLAQKERGQVIMTSVIFSSGGNMSL